MQSDLVARAAAFAKAVHDATGKVRKLSGLSYFTHPQAVAALLLGAGAPPELAAAGFLHDTVEDAGVTLQQLLDQFGPRVAELVNAVSEAKGLPWRARKAHTVADLQATEDLQVVELVLADKLDNVADLVRHQTPDMWGKFNAPFEAQRWYYTTLGEVFLARLPSHPLAAGYVQLLDQLF